MLTFTKEIFKEILVLLIATNIIWFLTPRWIRNSIKRVTKLIYRGGKYSTTYAKERLKEHYKQYKKATPKEMEQPKNVITITYPNGNKKTYRKAK